MKYVSILLAVFLFLSGCMSGDGIGMKESPAWHQTADLDVKIQHFKQECLGFGFKLKTPELAQCVQNQMNDSKASAKSRMSNYFANRKKNRISCVHIGNIISCN